MAKQSYILQLFARDFQAVVCLEEGVWRESVNIYIQNHHNRLHSTPDALISAILADFSDVGSGAIRRRSQKRDQRLPDSVIKED